MATLISNWRRRTRKRLVSHGVVYMFPSFNEWTLLAIRLITGVVIAAVLADFSLTFAVAAAVIGSFIPDLLIYISNMSDNEAMLSDIESIYDIMKIQARAGVFVQDSLMDCYVNTSNKRLKAAMLELCNQTGTNKTMEEAVHLFSTKFSNRHIDVLCIVLTQAQSSGKTVQILSDMNEQINQLKHQRAKKEEGKLERRIEVLELLIFVGVLAIGVFAMGNEIAGMINF